MLNEERKEKRFSQFALVCPMLCWGFRFLKFFFCFLLLLFWGGRPFLAFAGSSPLWFDSSFIAQLIFCGFLLSIWGILCLLVVLPGVSSVGKSENSFHKDLCLCWALHFSPWEPCGSPTIRAGGGEGYIYKNKLYSYISCSQSIVGTCLSCFEPPLAGAPSSAACFDSGMPK